jgi:predicted dehydrogenase
MNRTSMRGVAFEPRQTVRAALLGCGGRGRWMMHELQAAGGKIVAVYDVHQEAASKAADEIEQKGHPRPRVVVGDDPGAVFSESLDLALIASPWDWHVPHAVAAMEAGAHAAVEVPAAVTLAECWKLVETSERTRKHCVILENCCYGYEELMMWNMARAGQFGTITHGEAAYIHDLRSLLLADSSEGLWRREPHKRTDGNFYPTHGLGPIARCMGINDDDRFEKLVSMSSREASLTEYRDANAPGKADETYLAGDINTSLIRTKKGRTIVLWHDVVTPRPYSRGTLLQGTKGAFRDFPAGVFFDGQEGHEWKPLDDFKAEWEHPLWAEQGERARTSGGHGGMDFLLCWRLLECFQKGLAPDIDVYDAAAWSAPTALSIESVKTGSMPVAFPDFLGTKPVVGS